MWYLIYARDAENSLPLRREARPRHLERVKQLVAEGRLLTAGPLPAIDSEDPGPAGFLGSVLIVDFESLEAARAWAEADPYVQAGVYRDVQVFPYKPVMP